jgi:chromate transporter
LLSSASAIDDDVPSRLSDLASLFLKLGITSFGGPAVHIAMMENEVVRRRRWMTHEESGSSHRQR